MFEGKSAVEISLADYMDRIVKYTHPETVSMVLLHLFLVRICKVASMMINGNPL